jgi:hypothetical protein
MNATPGQYDQVNTVLAQNLAQYSGQAPTWFSYIAWRGICVDLTCPSLPAANATPTFDWQTEDLYQLRNMFVYTAASSTLVGCSFQNVTYSLQFDFWGHKTGPISVRDITIHDEGDFELPHSDGYVDTGPGEPSPNNPRCWPYRAMMIAWWTPLVGKVSTDHYGVQTSTTLAQSTTLGSLLGQNTSGAAELIAALEGLFTNFTLSLFSDSSFL